MALSVVDHQARPAARAASLRMESLGPAIGAETSGLDLSRLLPDEAVAGDQGDLAARGVVLFHDQRVSPE